MGHPLKDQHVGFSVKYLLTNECMNFRTLGNQILKITSLCYWRFWGRFPKNPNVIPWFLNDVLVLNVRNTKSFQLIRPIWTIPCLFTIIVFLTSENPYSPDFMRQNSTSWRTTRNSFTWQKMVSLWSGISTTLNFKVREAFQNDK